MKNLRLRQLRETSVLRLRLAYRVGEGGSSVTLVIGGKDSTDEGFCLERIRWVGGWWDCHPVSAVFIRIERVFTMTTERGGARSCGHPCSCVVDRFPELGGDATRRHRVNGTCNHLGERLVAHAID